MELPDFTYKVLDCKEFHLILLSFRQRQQYFIDILSQSSVSHNW